MSIEVNSTTVICSKCGMSYGRRKGNFAVNYGILYKGVGYLTICKTCLNKIYTDYLSETKNPKDAVRQVCRKLDLYWNEQVFNVVERKNTTRALITSYIAKINTVSYAGKSYDDTLIEEGALWNFSKTNSVLENTNDIKKSTENLPKPDKEDVEQIEIPDEVVALWGTGYTPEMYQALEQRRSYWLSRFPEDTVFDIGTEAIIRQICSLELDINRDRAAGRPVDKSVNALNTLLGSANLKPTQKKDDPDSDISSTPLGVWLYRFENKRPLPEIDDQLKDVNHVKKYVFTWLGHLVKMLGLKNGYSKLYDEEIERLRVEKPEYADEDEEDLLIDAYSELSENIGDQDG